MSFGIAGKLTAIFLVLIVSGIVMIAAFDQSVVRTHLRDAAAAQMLDISSEKAAAIDSWLSERRDDVAQLANDPRLSDPVTAMIEHLPSWHGADPHAAAREAMATVMRFHRFHALVVLDASSGQIQVATQPDAEGHFREDRAYFLHGLHELYIDTPYYSLDGTSPFLAISGPLRDGAGRVVAVLAGFVELDMLQAIVARSGGGSRTEHSYLVNGAHLFLTEPTDLRRPGGPHRAMFEAPITACLTGKTGVATAHDYRDVPVLMAYRWMPDRRFCLVSQTDSAEVMAPALRLGRLLLSGTLIVIAIAFLVSVLFARRLAAPVLALADAVDSLARGRGDVRIPVRSRDELGAVTEGFNAMAEALQRRETELLRSREELALALGQMQQGLAHFDGERRLTLYNPAFASIFGFRDGMLATRPDFAQLVADMAERHLLAEGELPRLLSLIDSPSGLDTDVTETLRFSDGRSIEVRYTPIAGGGSLTLCTDSTDRRRQEESLRAAHEAATRANMARSDFLASMSHELRTPLNAVLGFAQLLQRSGFGSLAPRQAEFVANIQRSGEHLLALVNEVLELTKIETGQIQTHIRNLRVAEIVAAVCDMLSPLAASRNVRLVLAEMAPGCDIVTTDQTRLMQALVNLGSNAIKYNHPGGTVRLSVEAAESDWVRFIVADNGPGIPKERQGELFQPFNRLGAENGPIEGTGIGLSITKRLVDLIGGRLDFTSEPGRGSRFWIDLPLAAEATDEDETASLAPVTGGAAGGLTVLYVEDNPISLEIMRGLIETVPDTRLIEAETGEMGLIFAAAHRPDAVVLDINLPDVDGYAVLRRLREDPATAHIPVIALSAAAMPEDMQRGINAGFRNYLVKPVRFSELLDLLEEIANDKRAA